MSSDSSSKKRYVSTLRMYIGPTNTSPGQGKNILATSTTSATRTSATATRTGIDTAFSTGNRCPTPTPLKGLDPPLFTEPLEDCSADEGSDITLRGVITGSQPISVSWLHNGEAVFFGEPLFDGSETRLVVRECLPEDAGAYTCVAENRAGKTSSSAAVCVRDFETICGVLNATSHTTPPLNNNIMENRGSKLLLSSNNDSVFRQSSSPISSNTLSPGGPRKVPPVSTEVTPKKRASSGTASLQFKDPPSHIEARLGETARLTCVFGGCPPVVSCWIRNKEPVVDGSELWVESSDQSSTLVIAEPGPEHSGRYTVVVRDRKSSAQHTLALSVIERPQSPASSPVVSLLSVSPLCLVLSWSGPCYDGGSAVLGYVVEVRRKGPAESGGWSELTAHCKSTSYKVRSGLEPQGEYCFRVRAYNVVGVSEPSEESQLIKMEQIAEPQEESLRTYEDVTIDSTHKVTDHYNVLEKLGVGKFGQVFKLTHKETGHVCAGKFYKGRRAKEREAARKEIELMNFLHHPKLVQCLGAYDLKPEMVMVMEFIGGGELFERIVDDSFVHTEPASVHYMQQIVEGMGYMHQKNIIHLDLKPENIVCVDHTGTHIKIIDFGLASKLDPSTPLKVMHGTPEFVAPEVIGYEPVSLATDMWSIGVICYILLSGESPFQGNSEAETLALVTGAQWEFDEESFDEITDQAKDFISSLLNKEPRRRISCEEALVHSWIAEPILADPSITKCLSKEKMKRYLAKQKWKKTGKALLALKRMALLSKADGPGTATTPAEDSPLSPEAEQALQSLEVKLQGVPQFSLTPTDQTASQGSTARLSCHLTGYPDPEVVWLRGEEPLEESSRVQIEYEEDGLCTLVLVQVGPEDSDVYTCRATNDQGKALCSAKLIVKE
ncbi:myosin light chain kinase, smooth muscle-like isoform X1 [Salvelinus namaycush]|uniref:Myosin light chain kinase, smooth muscle-like isoform X1 n=1 Tax=Salvelinus namaycush TaxID=8040 RepID=A0A8U0Q3Y9_SALNM|nr:myosin light chain kinase, smooth muscle-like isoform X1 [Salvelinus namaycush]